MQAFILSQHVHQSSLQLLHGNCDGAFAESLTQLSHPRLYRLHFVLQFATFALCRTGGLQTPHMLLIGPIDPHERSKLRLLRLPTHCAFWHNFYLSSLP